MRATLGALVALVLVALASSACSSSTTAASNEAQGSNTDTGTAVHFTSSSGQSSVAAAVALWKQLNGAGVTSTITAYDDTSFSLSTTDPARLRQAVAASSTTATNAKGCPTEAPVERPTAPSPQPATGGQAANGDAFQTAGVMKAGTPGEDAFDGGQIREVAIDEVRERPPTYVVGRTNAQGRVAAADIGPGLIVVQEMFVDPADVKLTRPPGEATSGC